MAMTSCKECKNQISTEAEKCPHCGSEAPKPTSRLKILFVGIFIFIVARAVTTSIDPPVAVQKTETEIAVAAKKEADFQRVVKVAAWLKQNTKNPDSFVLTYGGLTDKGAVCIEYRGTNSFNAIVPGRYVMSSAATGDTVALWNKHCANQPVTDLTNAKYAL